MILEDYSSSAHVTFLSIKSNALKSFNTRKAENSLNNIVKCIRSDRGGEIMLHEF